MKNIITYPNELLRTKSKPVQIPLSKEDKEILNDMYEYLKEHADEAVGLAAVQLGEPKKMCAIRYKDSSGKLHAYKLVNPVIVKRSHAESVLEEGCLSEPELGSVKVKRHTSIMVLAYNAMTNKHETMTFAGFEARVVQHEIDHMNGKLLIDYQRKEKENA